MKEIVKKVIEPLCCENIREDSEVSEAKKRLLDSSSSLIRMISQSILNSWNFAQFEDALSLSLIKSTENYGKAFDNYTRSLCDCLVSEAFKVEHDSKMAKTITELLSSLCHIQKVVTKLILFSF